jgi:GGDEF domain-containing protein
MEDLREAVDALGHYLDAAQLVRTATEVPSLAPEAWSSPPEQARFQAEVERPGVDDPGFRRFRDRATGLYTRAGFEAIAEGELKRCVRHSREFSLLLIRLSKAAEADVRGAAGAVRNGLRASDPVGYSGSRLLLIGLPETSEEESRAISRRLVKALETRGVWGDGAHTGLASRTNDGESLSGLIEAARKGG